MVKLLRRQILEGDYAFEERLPAERNLAQEFGVSRGTIRSVLQILEQQHLVSARSAAAPTCHIAKPPTNRKSPALPARSKWSRCASPSSHRLVRLAIANASSRDLDELREALRQCEACDGDSETFARADTAFHMALAHCSRNKLMYWLYDRISEVRRNAQWRRMKAKVLTADRINFYNRQHSNFTKPSRRAILPPQCNLSRIISMAYTDDLLDTD